MKKVSYVDYEEEDEVVNQYAPLHNHQVTDEEPEQIAVFNLYIKIWKYHFGFNINREKWVETRSKN